MPFRNDRTPPRAARCGPWRRSALAALLVGGSIGIGATKAAAAEIELLHMWTSESETRALQSLPSLMAARGVALKTTAVAGGADALDQALRERVQARKLPDAVQMKATDLVSWGDKGILASLDALAKADDWEHKIPRQIADLVKYKGVFVAIPINVHRVNRLYINRRLLQQVQGRVPENWSQFFQLAERFQKAGIPPLSHGDQPWQNLTLFEIVVLGVGGADYYRRALVQREAAALEEPTMERAMQTFVALKPLTQMAQNAGGGQEWSAAVNSQDWSVATARVISGKAAMQIMGDWAKGDFLAAQMLPDQDFVCAASPGGYGSYMYVVDSLAVLRKGKETEASAEQNTLAQTATGLEFQARFNLAKGSIPIVPGVDMNRFDPCGRDSSNFFLAARLANTLVPSVAHRMALSGVQHQALEALVDRLWKDGNYSPAQAQRDLLTQVRNRALR